MLQKGEQTKLADAAGMSRQFLNDIMQGRKRCPSAVAVKLELISQEVLGRKVLAREWILAGLGIRINGGLNDRL